VPIELPKANHTREIHTNTPSSGHLKKYNLVRYVMEKGKLKEEPPKKTPKARKETVIKEVKKLRLFLILKLKWIK
jgi:hypothetical protein